ncbi:DCC1-like thiol-disulfide oxidoreductase family protein [Flavobacterium sp.]|uniref:DCC1-like thiol-disulfide oxidoreductase family protein n=1 Tax=Flavobacterium sp. TaxID=239 RepID=UPI0039E70F27
MKNLFRNILNHKIDALGLSIFRVLYALVLFCEVTHMFIYRNIIFDRVPFVNPGEFTFGYLYTFYVIALVLLALGLFTRLATIVNYIFGVIIFSSASTFEYHVYYTYVGVNFFLMFMPVSRVFSLDSLIQKVKYTNIGKLYRPDRKVLEMNYLIPVYVGIALVYFDSIFLKMNSTMWQKGLGIWLPSSLPMVTWFDTSILLNQKGLVIFLSYFVMAFETLFVFLMWFRKLRPTLVFIGVFFHIGILMSYPIPWFALTYIVIYLLLLPPDLWLKIGSFFKAKNPVYTFYYDAECPLCIKVVTVIRHLDVFNRVRCLTVQGHFQNEAAIQNIPEETLLINIHGVTANGKVSVGFWAYVQLFKAMGYTYPLGLLVSLPGISAIGKKIYAYIAGERLTVRCTSENCTLPEYPEPTREDQDLMVKGWNQLAITKKVWKWVVPVLFLLQCFVIATPNGEYAKGTLAKATKAPKAVLRKYFGIGRHAVFLDFHFKGYNHIFKIVYVNGDQKILVPIVDENGMPSDYVSGSTWRNISFNVVNTVVRQENLETGIKPYLTFFLLDQKLDTQNAHFEFYVKEVEVPTQWEKDFLHKQIAKPWKKAGQCDISKAGTHFEWNAMMQQILANETK